MVKSNLKIAESVNSETPQDREIRQFTDFIISLVSNRKTPRAVRNAIAVIVIDELANTGGYAWHEDEEGLRFMLPRILSNMNEMYASGIISATVSVLGELVPADVKARVLQGGAANG
jgi:hypothetical protein